MGDRIKLDVNGHLYRVPADIIENGPPSRLTRMYKTGLSMSKYESIVINRPSESFAAILAFYQTGELHIPMTSCPSAFMSELEYWEISPELISDCCYNKLQSFINEQETVRKFKEGRQLSKPSSNRCFGKVRANIWEVVLCTKPTLIGRVYFSVTLFMVLLSLTVLGYGTDPSFKREMTNCERLEYMALSNMEGYDVVEPYLKQFCSDSNLPFNASKGRNSTEQFMLLGQTNGNEQNDFLSYLFFFVHQILAEKSNAEPISGDLNTSGMRKAQSETENISHNESVFVNGTNFDERHLFENLTFTLNENITFYNDETLRVYPLVERLLETKHIKVPNFRTKVFILVILDSLTTMYFTIDIILRLSCCPSIKLYFLSVTHLTDALSLLGEYLYFLLYYLYPVLRYETWIDYCSYMQMLRSLRLFHIVASLRAGKVLAYSARKNVKDISVLFLFLIAGMCTFATLFYIFENESTIKSIPAAWYWALITMTTVGYGDIQPQTQAGRLVACICAVSGVVLLALTVPIFANHFLILYQHAESEHVVNKFQTSRQSARDAVKLNTKIDTDSKSSV